MNDFLSNWSKDFIRMFNDGKIDGEIQYMIRIESLTDIPAAYIPIQYKDAKGNLIKDSVLLIKRNKNWYLIGM
jgi:hypothetical protein